MKEFFVVSMFLSLSISRSINCSEASTAVCSPEKSAEAKEAKAGEAELLELVEQNRKGVKAAKERLLDVSKKIKNAKERLSELQKMSPFEKREEFIQFWKDREKELLEWEIKEKELIAECERDFKIWVEHLTESIETRAQTQSRAEALLFAGISWVVSEVVEKSLKSEIINCLKNQSNALRDKTKKAEEIAQKSCEGKAFFKMPALLQEAFSLSDYDLFLNILAFSDFLKDSNNTLELTVSSAKKENALKWTFNKNVGFKLSYPILWYYQYVEKLDEKEQRKLVSWLLLMHTKKQKEVRVAYLGLDAETKKAADKVSAIIEKRAHGAIERTSLFLDAMSFFERFVRPLRKLEAPYTLNARLFSLQGQLLGVFHILSVSQADFELPRVHFDFTLDGVIL